MDYSKSSTGRFYFKFITCTYTGKGENVEPLGYEICFHVAYMYHFKFSDLNVKPVSETRMSRRNIKTKVQIEEINMKVKFFTSLILCTAVRLLE